MSKSETKKNLQNNTPKKKKGCFYALLWTVLPILIIAAALTNTFLRLFVVYTYEENRPICWKSGEVIIGDIAVTLPCEIEEFDKLLGVSAAPDPEENPYTKTVHVSYNGSLIPLSVHSEGDYVTGFSTDSPYVIFPGGVTVESNMADIPELYSTKPLNIYGHYWSEELTNSDSISSNYRYVDYKSYEIAVNARDDQITDIFYIYLSDDFTEEKSE